MTFIEMVEKVARETGMPKTKVKGILRTAASIIDLETRVMGREVKWVDFGRFSQRKTKAGKAFGRSLTPRPATKFNAYGR